MDASAVMLAFGVLIGIGLLALLAIHLLEERISRSFIVTVALFAAILIEKAIFDFAIPAGVDTVHDQVTKCTGASYSRPGCPGYRP